jgi:uncharacterized membrane protein YoaK (UPF0700 family)
VRATTRDKMLLLLALSAGSADSWSFLGLGHAFVANMTGNTVLLGIAVFQKNGDLLHPFASLIAYVTGVATASYFTRNLRAGALWAKAISAMLWIEALLLIAAEAGWVALQHYPGSPASLRYLLLAVVALAVGLQSGAMLQLNVPGIVTTYITGTLTQLTSGLVRFGTQASATRGEQVQFEQRLWMQFGILAAYFLSALLAGLFFRYLPQAVGALAAAPVIIVAVCSTLSSREP